jgi:hypothetical protein
MQNCFRRNTAFIEADAAKVPFFYHDGTKSFGAGSFSGIIPPRTAAEYY